MFYLDKLIVKITNYIYILSITMFIIYYAKYKRLHIVKYFV